MTDTDLLKDIESFLAKHHKKMGVAKFGLLCLGDPDFVRELRNGRKPRAATETKIREWMEDYDAREQERLLA